jgi:hypothetical protein
VVRAARGAISEGGPDGVGSWPAGRARAWAWDGMGCVFHVPLGGPFWSHEFAVARCLVIELPSLEAASRNRHCNPMERARCGCAAQSLDGISRVLIESRLTCQKLKTESWPWHRRHHRGSRSGSKVCGVLCRESAEEQAALSHLFPFQRMKLGGPQGSLQMACSAFDVWQSKHASSPRPTAVSASQRRSVSA